VSTSWREVDAICSIARDGAGGGGGGGGARLGVVSPHAASAVAAREARPASLRAQLVVRQLYVRIALFAAASVRIGSP
jgi:hypothetical protein